MELRVLIPTACVLGVLLIVTLVLVIVLIVRARQRKREIRDWQQHGIVEDNVSFAWSEHGPSRGVSVREGKLVRSQSRKKTKEARTTVEQVRDDNDNYSVKQGMGSLDFMNSISGITGRISPGIGRALSIGSHKTSTLSSEKSRQLSPLPATDEGSQTSSSHLVDMQKRPSSSGRKKSSHSRSSSRSNIHESPIPEDMTMYGRESILLPSPPSSVHILTPTYSRHSRQSQSNSSFTFTPVTPRASISLFPLSAPPGQHRRPSVAAPTAPNATLANHTFSNHMHSARRPSFLQNSYTFDHMPSSPSSSFSNSQPTLAEYSDELAPRPGSRPKVSQIQIPEPKSVSPRAPLSATHSSDPDSPENVPDHHAQVNNFENWTFGGGVSYGNNRMSDSEDGNFPTPYNDVPRPQYTRAPSSAVGNPGIPQSRKESITSYAQMRRESIRRDSFGGAIPFRRESHGPSMLRRDSTASFLGSPPKFATGPRVYHQHLSPNIQPQHHDSIIRTYSDRSLHGFEAQSSNERQNDPMNINPLINESKTSIVSVSSTGSAASDSFTGNGGLSPPPLQKNSFEGTRSEGEGAYTLAAVSTKLLQQTRPPVTPPRHAHGMPFGGSGTDSQVSYETSPPSRRPVKDFVPETVAEMNENLPASPKSTITNETVTENSIGEMSPSRMNGGT
ncbi:hypothetical protein TWF481_008769 [Arthrobotrys musiformis]|uniref:Uncharacterized protein n=1 Tax=Arthrobotrys musiformis TaxID=47236 RepID=A0AAV9W856_9PEZI